MAEQIQISAEEYELLKQQIALLTEQNQLLKDEKEARIQSEEKIISALDMAQAEIRKLQEEHTVTTEHMKHIVASKSAEEILKTLNSLGTSITHAENCTVYNVDAVANERLFTVAESGERDYLFLDGSSLMQQAIEKKEPVIFNDINTLPTYAVIGDSGSRPQENVAVIPMSNREGEVIGVAVLSDKEGGFTNKDVAAFDLQTGNIGSVYQIGLEREAELQKQCVDKLTQLPNRSGAEMFMKTAPLYRLRHDEPVSVLMIDIDKFKKFNDVYGHDIGDKCLHQVAQTIADNIRQATDSAVFRWGGEEMVIVLPVDESRAAEIADRVRRAVNNNPIIVDAGSKLADGTTLQEDLPVNVSISLGVSQMQVDSLTVNAENIMQSFEKTMKEADGALYFAKEHGRNQVAKAADISEAVFDMQNLEERLVLGNNEKNLFVNPADSSVTVYTGFNGADNPDLIATLQSRAACSPLNTKMNMDEFMRDCGGKLNGENVVVNIMAFNADSIQAELESPNGKIIKAPLTEDEAKILVEQMQTFMAEKGIEADGALRHTHEALPQFYVDPADFKVIDHKTEEASNAVIYTETVQVGELEGSALLMDGMAELDKEKKDAKPEPAWWNNANTARTEDGAYEFVAPQGMVDTLNQNAAVSMEGILKLQQINEPPKNADVPKITVQELFEQRAGTPEQLAEQFKLLANTFEYDITRSEDGNGFTVYDEQTELNLQNADKREVFKDADEIADRINAAILEHITDTLADAINDEKGDLMVIHLGSVDEKVSEELQNHLAMNGYDVQFSEGGSFFFAAKEEYAYIETIMQDRGIAHTAEDLMLDTPEKLAQYLTLNPEVTAYLTEQGYGSDIVFNEIVANHLSDIDLSLAVGKMFDAVSIDRQDNDSVTFDEKSNIADVHVSMSDTVMVALLHDSGFESKESDPAIEYGDLYVDYDRDDGNKTYSLILTMSDDTKVTFDTMESRTADSEIKPLIVSDDIRAAIDHAVVRDCGKPIEALAEDMAKEAKDIED